MTILGSDQSGVTEESINAITQLYMQGEKLEEIAIVGSSSMDIICTFTFEGNKVYKASGFSIGYGGEGCRGLWKMIQLFYSKNKNIDFKDSKITNMEYGKWRWNPNEDFKKE